MKEQSGIRLPRHLRLPVVFSVNTEMLASLAIIMYFIQAAMQRGFQFITRNDDLGSVIGMTLPYVAALILCCLKPKRYLRLDFIYLMTGILTFFIITLWICPDYLPYYSRAEFGVWDHVLMPSRGIYAFLFIRLLRDPEKIHKALRISAHLMTFYFIYRIFEALRRGYWVGVGVQSASTIQMQYSVTFGYEVLPFALLLLYTGLADKNLLDLGVAAAQIVMILIGGSRGPILFVGVFLVLYMMIVISRSKKKFLIISVSVIALLLLVLFYKNLLEMLIAVLDHFGFSSRFFTTLLEGTVTDDNNRSMIWGAAINMILENPFGYGAMGSRHEITQYIYAGYPHNIILEFLIDYGVLPGLILLGLLFWGGYKVLFNEKYKAWRCLALPYFSTTGALMGSMTYWSVPFFWTSVAVIISAFQYTGNLTVKEKLIRLLHLENHIQA